MSIATVHCMTEDQALNLALRMVAQYRNLLGVVELAPPMPMPPTTPYGWLVGLIDWTQTTAQLMATSTYLCARSMTLRSRCKVATTGLGFASLTTGSGAPTKCSLHEHKLRKRDGNRPSRGGCRAQQRAALLRRTGVRCTNS